MEFSQFCRSCLAGLLLLSLSMPGFAGFRFSQIRDLDRAGQSQAAYELALEYRDEYEGYPPFDYLYGIAAINSGHYGEGVFALERVVSAEPKNNFARTELGRGYLLRHEYASARGQYETVLRQRPKPVLVPKAQGALHIIDRRQSRFYEPDRVYVDAGFGYDSNINSASDDESVIAGDTSLLVPDESREASDRFTYFGAGGWTAGTISHGVSWYGRVDGSRKTNLSEPFDIDIVSGQAGLRRQSGLSDYSIGVLGQKFYVDGDVNRNLVGLSAQWNRELSYRTDVLAYGQFMQLDYPDQRIRDSELATVGLGVKRILPHRWKPVVRATVYGLQERADNTEGEYIAERDSYGARLSLDLVINPSLKVQGAARYQSDDYKGTHPTFLKTRDDEYFAVELGARWRLKRNWSALIDVEYSDNDSNITIHDYSRTVVTARARYDFR